MNFNDNSLYNCLVNRDGERYSLFDLAIWKNGLAFKNINFSDCGVPVIKIAELNNGIGGTTAYTNQSFQEDVHLHKGDLLFSWSGNPDTSIDIFRFQLNEGWLNQHIFKVTPNEKLIDKDYFYFLMKFLKPIFTKIAKNKQTTGLGHVTIGDIKQLNVVIPDMMNQRQIVSVLKPIDDKITLNNAINCNLQNQAQALFKSWFIDFEPFGGSAPSEWCESTFGQIAVLKTDSWSPTKNPNELIEHYSIPALDEQHYPVFETSSDIKSNKYIINSNSVMISKLNPDTKRIWRPLCITDNSVCSTEFIVFEARKKEHKDFVYSILDSTPFLNYLCSHTTGSTNSRQRANPKSTLDYSLLLPPDTVVNDFCHIVTPMYDLINANIIENQELSKTRDILLPKLMTGEIDVSKLEL